MYDTDNVFNHFPEKRKVGVLGVGQEDQGQRQQSGEQFNYDIIEVLFTRNEVQPYLTWVAWQEMRVCEPGFTWQ